MYDAIVIGARCGGAATAMLLARKGHRVLLVDRATFPSDIPHGHFIHRSGPTRLAKWGLLDRVLATGCPAITSFTSDFGDFPLVGNDLSVDGVPFACGPRRAALDRVLVDAAVEAGAELRSGFSVESLTMDGDRVTGIRGGDRRAGTSVSEHARITIGADGRNSHVARAVGAPEYDTVPSLTCWYFSYWAGVVGESVEVYDCHGRVCFAFPTNDNLFAGYSPGDSIPGGLGSLRILAPVAPSKILCVGLNYKDHAAEVKKALPADPLLFIKPPTSVLNPGDAIKLPPGVGRVDYEGEFAVVIAASA
jgi:flavin-dependent dehydrogenase